MPYCNQCGGKLNQGATYCQNCGSSVSSDSASPTAGDRATQQSRGRGKRFLKWGGIGCAGLLCAFVLCGVIIGITVEETSEGTVDQMSPPEGPRQASLEQRRPDQANESGATSMSSSSLPTATLTAIPTATPTPVPTPMPEAIAVVDPKPTTSPTPTPTATSSHDGFDHINLGRLWPLTVADFDAYCGIIRDEYWHYIRNHNGTTFVFILTAANQLEFTPNEIARRLTLCGLDLNGEDCVGAACDWEVPPKLLPDGRMIPPVLKDQR